MEFTAAHITKVLTKVYGLPKHLFTLIDQYNFQLTEKKIHITIVPVSEYTTISALNTTKNWLLFEDFWLTKQNLVASKISWLAGEHEKLDARKCSVHSIDKKEAQHFLDKNHLMGYAQSAFHYALVNQKQVVAVAAFSKGRKMNRLPENQQSFELVRYACLPFVSITGGLTKLLDAFTTDKQPGDIMTYIDKLMGEKKSFEKIGFTLVGETAPLELYLNTTTFERHFKLPLTDDNYTTFWTTGNYKMIK